MLSFLAKLYIWAIRAPWMHEHGHKPFKMAKPLCFFSMFLALYALPMIHCTSIVQANCSLLELFYVKLHFNQTVVELF